MLPCPALQPLPQDKAQKEAGLAPSGSGSADAAAKEEADGRSGALPGGAVGRAGSAAGRASRSRRPCHALCICPAALAPLSFVVSPISWPAVYVGNVDYSCTPEELQMHFQSCGTVNRVTILTGALRGGCLAGGGASPPRCPRPRSVLAAAPHAAAIAWLLADKAGNPKGFAYIEFLEADAVANACLLGQSELRSRQIKVAPKRTNVPGMKAGRGRGGRSRGGRGGYPPYGMMPMMPPFMFGYGYPPYGGGGRGRGRGRGGYAPY